MEASTGSASPPLGSAGPNVALIGPDWPKHDEQGKTWVYARREELTFVRAPIEIAAIRGGDAILSSGPKVGTEVASVAAAELYGTEFEVDH